ncbi:MAG TPA: BREX-2 system adenine-specific DNA-methyltransferase PglX [Polyangiaceae bacterium]|nr:BREX-2 system adenine-specific DNA-methyltransferase PglX [Polyangiaceae bacterium]
MPAYAAARGHCSSVPCSPPCNTVTQASQTGFTQRVHRFDQRRLGLDQQLDFDADAQWGDRLFRLEDRREVERVLTRRFQAVVGNPPYITEKDSAKRKKYRDMYESAAGKYSLSAPFTERFFELAGTAGFVGLINSNAWAKRDFGKTLIEKVLPRFDLQQVIDTSGCYLPGHGTPTLLLFGRNRPASTTPAVAVLGKRGEQDVPADPSTAPVWTEIVRHHREVGFDGDYVSVERLERHELRRQPWILAGGGARSLYAVVGSRSDKSLRGLGSEIGPASFAGTNDAFIMPRHAAHNASVPDRHVRTFVAGDGVRDWHFESIEVAVAPYDDAFELVPISELRLGARHFWKVRSQILGKVGFGGETRGEAGDPYWAWDRWISERYRLPVRLVLPYVATHNHAALDRGGRVFNQHAPVLILKKDYGEADHQALLGYLNSSTVAFWCRLVMFPKGGDQVGDGARLSATQWNRHLEYAGNLLQQLPVPKLEDLKTKLLDLVVAAEETVARMAEHAADKVVAATLARTPKLAALRDARTKSLAERARLRGVLISLQEEIDWRVYGLFGLPTVEAPSVEAVRVPVEPNHRPFEVRLAREVPTDISASEWFRVHKREAPKDVAGPLVDLYRQRLRLLDDAERGKQLRLLETPETKRRWSPPDDTKAFSDAVRTWLLERIETSFREQAQPELRTVRQLALDLGRDPAVAAAHELLTEESGLDLARLLSDLVDAEGVPFLAGYRYAETGMEKRASWEETWRLQRLEDEGKLKPELERLKLKAIPVPDKYGPKDFLRHYWSLRGKLDVPKERFVTVPGGNTDEDTTPLVGWAGWNHLQVAQALSGLYQRRKTEDGWQKDRLLPLLAGLDERVPWLLQWHNEPSAAFGGMKLGEFFRDFVAGEAHALGVAVGDLRKWTPPAAPKRTALDPAEVLAALAVWKPEVDEDDEDDGEDTEPPEGPTDVELASAVGVTKALVAKALKKLIADGLVEKLSGRPARYVATGDQA